MSNIFRKAGAAVALVAAATTGVVTQASPAQAASAVGFCFQRAQTDAPMAYMSVYLYSFDSRGYTYERTGRTDHRGCGTFYNTRTDQKLQVFAYRNGAWFGTPYYAPVGSAGYHLGTGKVTV